MLKEFIAVWIVTVGTLQSMQTFEKDPRLLLGDEEKSVWRAGVESKATKYTTSGFFLLLFVFGFCFVRLLVPFAETFPAGHLNGSTLF